MKVVVPQIFDEFHCIGKDCPDTCCVGWLIEIDDASYERFMKLEGEFGEHVRKNIVEREDGHFFALDEEGKCCFLNKDHLCEMVIQYGDKMLCSLCDNYPRIGNEYGSLREMGLSLSCPEVSRLLFSSSRRILFGEWNTLEKDKTPDYTKDPIFMTLMDLRDELFGIMQDRKKTICDRLCLYLILASQLQEIIDASADGEERAKTMERMEELELRYQDENYIKSLLDSRFKKGETSEKDDVAVLLDCFDELEIINPTWRKMHETLAQRLRSMTKEELQEMATAFGQAHNARAYEYEHLLVYYIFRYFLKMIFDGDIYSKAAMVAATILYTYLSGALTYKEKGEFTLEDQIKLQYLYSKEVEHSEENMAVLSQDFWEVDCFDVVSLVRDVTSLICL